MINKNNDRSWRTLDSNSRRPRLRLWVWLVLAAIVAGVVYLYRHYAGV
jgi:type VI protein secretion system component VasF